MPIPTTAYVASVEPIQAQVEVIEEVESIYCSCIKTARLLGVKIPIGTDAEHIKHNSDMNSANLVRLSYSTGEHIAVIKGFTNNGIKIAEGNFKKCKYTERIIPFNDKAIVGFVRI